MDLLEHKRVQFVMCIQMSLQFIMSFNYMKAVSLNETVMEHLETELVMFCLSIFKIRKSQIRMAHQYENSLFVKSILQIPNYR